MRSRFAKLRFLQRTPYCTTYLVEDRLYSGTFFELKELANSGNGGSPVLGNMIEMLRQLTEIRHPFISHYHQVFLEAGVLYILTDHLTPGNLEYSQPQLAGLIAKEGPLSVTQLELIILRFVASACLALHHLAERNVHVKRLPCISLVHSGATLFHVKLSNLEGVAMYSCNSPQQITNGISPTAMFCVGENEADVIWDIAVIALRFMKHILSMQEQHTSSQQHINQMGLSKLQEQAFVNGHIDRPCCKLNGTIGKRTATEGSAYSRCQSGSNTSDTKQRNVAVGTLRTPGIRLALPGEKTRASSVQCSYSDENATGNADDDDDDENNLIHLTSSGELILSRRTRRLFKLMLCTGTRRRRLSYLHVMRRFPNIMKLFPEELSSDLTYCHPDIFQVSSPDCTPPCRRSSPCLKVKGKAFYGYETVASQESSLPQHQYFNIENKQSRCIEPQACGNKTSISLKKNKNNEDDNFRKLISAAPLTSIFPSPSANPLAESESPLVVTQKPPTATPLVPAPNRRGPCPNYYPPVQSKLRYIDTTAITRPPFHSAGMPPTLNNKINNNEDTNRQSGVYVLVKPDRSKFQIARKYAVSNPLPVDRPTVASLTRKLATSQNIRDSVGESQKQAAKGSLGISKGKQNEECLGCSRVRNISTDEGQARKNKNAPQRITVSLDRREHIQDHLNGVDGRQKQIVHKPSILNRARAKTAERVFEMTGPDTDAVAGAYAVVQSWSVADTAVIKDLNRSNTEYSKWMDISEHGTDQRGHDIRTRHVNQTAPTLPPTGQQSLTEQV